MKNVTLRFGIWLFLCACGAKESVDVKNLNYRVDLDSIVAIYSTPYDSVRQVDLCGLFEKADWDSIAIILPYLPKEELDILEFNSKSARDSMEYVITVEWAQGLLFFKDGAITHYSVISGNPSFSEMNDSPNVAIPILRRSRCNLFLTNTVSVSNKQSLFFFLDKPKVVIPDAPKGEVSEKTTLDSLLKKLK